MRFDDLTNSQKSAVTENGNILVSAAAGSGKTAVLVERVIAKLTSKTEPISADKLLIVTFTNAAAAEMRGRIEKRLDEECHKNPEDTGLLLQKHLLASAKICTIDSFCIDFVRENFEKLNISPDFTISENSVLRQIDERVLAEILNVYFEKKDPIFMELLDIVGAEFDEGKFSDLVLNLYNYSRQLPFPNKWFDELLKDYSEGVFTKNNPWFQFAVETAKSTAKALRENIANAIDLVSVDEKMANKFLPIFIVTAELLDQLLDACNNENWDEIFNIISALSFPEMPRVNGSNAIPEVKAAKDIYDNIRKKGIENLYRLFYAKEDFISAQFKKLYAPIKLLTEILKEFSDKVFSVYLEENTLTFHNTEALALKLLCSEKDGEITINSEAKEFLSLYDEVCVDEYQDTNDLQNMLFYVLSNKDSNLFAVGDVKQSIYGFRGANPEHFLKKKSNHILLEQAKENEPKKIILGDNFRSRKSVCDFINYFFSCLMTKETNSILYDSEEMLNASGVFPECSHPSVSFDIIETGSDDENKVIEARRIADFIKKTLASGDIIKENETTLRKAEYRDFTILLRSMKNNAGIFAEELRRQGIPVNFSAEGFCEYSEIATILSLLKIIDNPRNDIELLTVMMSPIFGFTAEELAKIRIASKEGSLYTAVTLYAENGDKKTESFLKRIQKFRLFAVTNTLPQLLNILYDETGYLNTVLAYNDGIRRRNNLLLLVQYAEGYNASNGSISGFVEHIIKTNEKGLKSSGALSGDNTVKIMSIHASKGLQFPVCIIANTSSAFNNQDARNNCVYTTKHGIGFKYFDENDKRPYTTISREAILAQIKKESLEEELRLLYVAMTRAEDILHFTAVISNIQKKSQDFISRLLGTDCQINTDFWNRTHSYFDWLLSVLLLHPDGKELRGNGTSLFCRESDSHIKLNTFCANDIPNNIIDDVKKSPKIDSTLLEETQKCLAFNYEYDELLTLQSKVSVSVLANKAESEKYNFKSKPSFMSEGGISATGRGTAMHKVMEFFDFSKWQTPEAELERLVEWQFISETEANSVNMKSLKGFFESEVFYRMQKSSLVKREMRFLTELPAKIADPNLKSKFENESIIVQGAVDVCFVEDDGIVILDFKTDRADNTDSLATAYGEQLNIYAKALEKIFNKRVKEKIIYSFSLLKEINV